MPKKQSGNKRNKQNNFAKLSIFQPNKYKFKRNCPFSVKGAPKIDYKNIKLLNFFDLILTIEDSKYELGLYFNSLVDLDDIFLS